MRVVGPRPMVADLLDAELPWSLEEAVRQQLAGLDHGRRQVVEALAVYGRSASFEALLDRDRGRRRRSASTRCARSSTPAWSSRSATTSSGSPTPSSPTPSSTSCSAANGGGCTSAASRRCAGRRCSTTPRWRTTPRAPTATTRSPAIARRGAARYLREGADVLGPAPRRGGAVARRRTTPSCWRSRPRRHGAWTSAPRRSTTAVAVGEGGRRAARPHRRPALRRAAPLGARRRARIASPASPSSRSCWSSLDDRQLRGVAAWSLAQVHMISHRSADAVALGRAGPRRRPRRRRHAHRGPGARRAGRRQRRSASRPRGARRAARGVGGGAPGRRCRAADAGDQQRARARPAALGRGRRAARRDAGGQLTRRVRQARPGDGAAVGVRGRLRRRRPAAAAPGRRRGRAVVGPAERKLDVVGAGQPGPRGGSAVRRRRGATPGFVDGVPVVEAAALPAPRRRRWPRPAATASAAARLFDELLASPPLLDIASLAQPRGRARRAPAGARGRTGRRPRPRCSTAGSASTRRSGDPRPHRRAAAAGRRATTTAPPPPWRRCSPTPTRASPSR